MDESYIQEQIDRFINAARKAKLKVTPQRLVILEAVVRNGQHPDVESVYQNVRQKMPTVSLDTVYRTLWTLKDLGLVGTMGLSPERIRFDANTKPHHHFICTECGSIHDFEYDGFDTDHLPQGITDLGDVTQSHIELRGVCRVCRSNNLESTKKQKES